MFLGGRQLAVYFLAVAALMQETSGHAADQCGSILKLIQDGGEIPIEKAPYMAALLLVPPFDLHTSGFYCGASIIHERFLLTAAHCDPVYEPEIQDYPVIASIGSERYQNTSTNTIMEVEKFLTHEQYVPRSDGVWNDISLVKLKESVPFGPKIGKIKLPNKHTNVEPGAMVDVTGWGQISQYNKKLLLDLLQTSIPVLSDKCCHKADSTVDYRMICAGRKGRGSCYGDSGGPLVYKGVQVGIVSRPTRGGFCGAGTDVNTKVSEFVDWIHTTIANNL